MTLEMKHLDTRDETRSFEHGSIDVVNIAGATASAESCQDWIVGDNPCVMLDRSGSANYAKPAG